MKFRNRLYVIIFEADTPAGKAFDVALLILILLSVVAVMLDSVPTIKTNLGTPLILIEWFFTIIFSIEYILRIYAAKRRSHYIFSFYGIIDFVSIIPTYLSLIFIGSHYLLVIRALRLLRIFRIFKFTRYTRASKMLAISLMASRYKILVFFELIIILVIILGSMMYLIEGAENGFTSIPKSIYWAIVTLTTVGYGDIAPQTVLGQSLASIIMIIGYVIIAVPTGIITMEMYKHRKDIKKPVYCHNCHTGFNEESDALYCKYCGAKL